MLLGKSASTARRGVELRRRCSVLASDLGSAVPAFEASGILKPGIGNSTPSVVWGAQFGEAR